MSIWFSKSNLKYLERNNPVMCQYEFWNARYNLEEHCERDSKEKRKNASQRAPERSTILKIRVVCFRLIDHLLVQCIEKHLKIIQILFANPCPPSHWEDFPWDLAANRFQIVREVPLTQQRWLPQIWPQKVPHLRRLEENTMFHHLFAFCTLIFGGP